MRRLWALIDGLPPGGALSRSLRGAWWAPGSVEELLATSVELQHAQLLAWGGKKAQRHTPLRIPRPGDKPPARPIRLEALPDVVKARKGQHSRAREIAEARREWNRRHREGGEP